MRGLRTAAETLAGARFCSSVRRSSSTFTAASAADHRHHVSNSVEPIIYLCFRENIVSTNYVVRRMELNNGRELTVEGYKTFKHETRFNHPHCTTLGSEIIIPLQSEEAGFRDICWIDTAKRPIKLRVSKDEYSEFEVLTDKDVKYISLPKPLTEKMKIGVIGNQLYSIDLVNKQLFKMYPSANQFFDPYFNKFVSFSSKGRHVSAYSDKDVSAYRARREHPGWRDAIFFSESEKILATSCFGTYCFDVKNPINGWRVMNHPCFSILGLSSKALVMHNYHPDIGNFNLVFNVYSEIDLNYVVVFFMSNDLDYSHPIEHLIEMPKIYSKCLNATWDYSNFVQLGAQRFGILLNTYKWSSWYSSDGEHNIYLLTYEYDTIVNPASGEDKSRPNVDIRSRFLGAQVFRYKTMEKLNTHINNSEVELIGASFVLQSID